MRTKANRNYIELDHNLISKIQKRLSRMYVQKLKNFPFEQNLSTRLESFAFKKLKVA